MDHHTQEDTNKVARMEKENTSGHLEAESLHTMLVIAIKKEQPSTMIKMEMNKTDFTKNNKLVDESGNFIDYNRSDDSEDY